MNLLLSVHSLLFFFALVWFGGELRAEGLLLRGATLHPVSSAEVATADVWIENGIIRDVGPSLQHKADQVFELKGLHLYPGLISAGTDLGLVEVPSVRGSVDDRETGDYTPEVESWVAVNPSTDHLPVAMANGITHFVPIPQGKLLTGTSAVMQTRGWTIEDMLVHRTSAMHLFWPSHTLDLPSPGSTSSNSLDDQALKRKEKIREMERFFADARVWNEKGASPSTAPLWKAMKPVLEGKVPLMIHAQGRREIRAALEFAKKHPGLQICLFGARDAWMLAKEISELKIAVIYSEVFTLPSRTTDPYDIQFSAPKRLHEAGVKVAICDGLEKASASGQRNLPYLAAQALAFGLPEEAALAAITLVPAQLHGVADQIGSIEVGKEASLFATTGSVFDIRSEVRHVWIRGNAQSLETKHTRLAQQYRERPKKK